MMVRHILLIRFKPEATAEAIDAVEAAFLAIPSKIEGVDSVEWGENDSPENKNEGFTHCVLMTFTDDAARSHYLPHPEHKALVSIFRPTLDEIIVFDYTRQP